VNPALGIELDRTGEIPLGVQLAWALRARILAGELAPGTRLPGVRELAAETGVNTNTVRTVYARLEDDRLIQAEQGRGTFVAAGVQVDDRLVAVARRALAEAATAGLDPREVAAALYTRLGPAPAPATAPADDAPARRRALRAEIAALEREYADRRLAIARRDAGATLPRTSGGRLLSEDELRTQRDALAARLAALDAPAPEEPPQPPATATRSTAQPGAVVRFRLAY
jgi:DNA-binding transcriptional regulator YhcF (GntR family)